MTEIEALDRLIMQMFSDRDTANTIAITTLNIRLAQMNELRSVVTDTVARGITREEHGRLIEEVKLVQLQIQKSLADCLPREDLHPVTIRLEKLEERQANMQGRYSMIAIVVGFSLSVLSIVGHVIWPK